MNVLRSVSTNRKRHFPQWQWFCFYLDISVRIRFGEAAGVSIKHPHTCSLVVRLQMYDCAGSSSSSGRKQKQDLKFVRRCNDGRMTPWKVQTDQSVPAFPRGGCGSSLLILESCEEPGECWVWFNRAKPPSPGRSLNPPPDAAAARSYVGVFQGNTRDVRGRHEGERERGGLHRSETGKKIIFAHAGSSYSVSVSATWW